LLVVSFNSIQYVERIDIIIDRAQSSIISYVRFRFITALNSVLFSSLRLVVHADCDTQDSLMRGGLCLPHLHSTPRENTAMTFGMEN